MEEVRKMPDMQIAVLIPCYDEEMTIEKVITDWRHALPEATIYVYDNNSDDRTAEIALKAGVTVGYEPEKGKGNVIRRMFEEIQADCYILTDGDDTYSADRALDLLRGIQEGADMVIGDRLSTTYYEENKKKIHAFGNRLVQRLINRLFHADIPDVMTGCRALSREFIKRFQPQSHGFEIETEMTIFALQSKMIIRSVPIQYRDRPEGSKSKIHAIKDGVRILHTIWKMHWRGKSGKQKRRKKTGGVPGEHPDERIMNRLGDGHHE